MTLGALAAMRMQEELRLAQPNRGDDRLAMRIVLTLGDVLHQEGALVGDAVVLAARIEGITPVMRKNRNSVCSGSKSIGSQSNRKSCLYLHPEQHSAQLALLRGSER